MKHKVIISLVMILTLITGCTSNINSDEIKAESPQKLVAVTGQNENIVERSELLSDVIVDLYGIDDATTIIFNDSALIAVKMAYDQKITEDTRELIKNKVMNTDPYIGEVLVSNKDRVFNEIDNVVLELLQGKSYESLVDNISKIKNRFN